MPLTEEDYNELNSDIPEFSTEDFPDSVFDSSTKTSGRYGPFGGKVDYVWRSGLLQLPIAQDSTSDEPKPSSVIVRVAAPHSNKVVTYFVERLTDMPLLPAPETDDNLELLYAKTSFNVAAPDVSGAIRIYAASLTYYYACLRPITIADGFSVGAFPFMAEDPSDNFVQPSTFQQGIIGGDPPTSEPTPIPDVDPPGPEELPPTEAANPGGFFTIG